MATARRGRHRRGRYRRLPLTAAAGSATIALAFAGTLTTQTADAADSRTDKVLPIQAPSRPAVPAEPQAAPAPDPFSQLTDVTNELAVVTEEASTTLHQQIRDAEIAQQQEEERRQAAERAAREAAERERLARMWVPPVSDYRISSHFGGYRGHGGLDMAGPYGQPVRSAHGGTVTFTGWAGSYGNKVVVLHPDGTETWYAHLASITVGLGPVSTGAQVGTLGSTGNSTGPHLHLEVRTPNGSRVDPYSFFRTKGVGL